MSPASSSGRKAQPVDPDGRMWAQGSGLAAASEQN